MMSREKRAVIAAAAAQDDDDGDYEPPADAVAKTAEERARIEKAVSTNFLFQHLNDQQREVIFQAFERFPVKAGQKVIKQGDPGDKFYVVDTGEYETWINGKDGAPAKWCTFTRSRTASATRRSASSR